MRKTKIICTLGPSTDKEGVLEKIVQAGMNTARMNFSHSTYEDHSRRLEEIKELRKKYNKHISVLLDTKGPEIRTKNFKDGKVFLTEGQEFMLSCEDIEGTETGVSVTYTDLYKEVKQGTIILIDDGLVELRVARIEGKNIHCIVKNDGYVGNHKGINVPDVHINMPFVSDKDREDILFGIENDVDFIAASFVRSADDVKEIRSLLDENGGKGIKIISKIENGEGVENIDEIIEVSDGIMIARGDMGVELPVEEVPIVQKMIIRKVYEAGKLVITATQMLESMINNPRPTRAEATDIANAIYDGTSAIMLSGETAAGHFPVEAVRTMVRIAERAENDINYKNRFFHLEKKKSPNTTDAICHATCTTAYDLGASAIVTVTKSGTSARMISRYRPDCMIIAGSTDEKVCRQLNLSWGVNPILLKEKQDVFSLFEHVVEIGKRQGYLDIGQLVVITSGVPMGISGTTNMLKVHIVD